MAAVFVDFPNNKCNFLHRSKPDIVRRVQFLTGRRPMRTFSPGAVATLPCGSQRLWLQAALSSKPTARLLMSVNGTELKDGRTPDRYIVTYFFGLNRFQCLLCTFSSLPVFKYFLYACSSIHFTFFTIAIGWLAIAKWLACWTQARKGPVSNRSRDAVG